MFKSASSCALLGALLLSAPALDAQRGRATASRSGPRTALLVMVENGGVASNFAECKVGKRPVRLPSIPVARCGTLGIALNPGENVAQMVGRFAKMAIDNRRCINPRSWKVERLSFDAWFKLSSDYLLEELTKTIQTLQRARSKYGTVVVLEDARFAPKEALSQMRRLAAQGYTMDIHLLCHGGNEAFYGGDNARFDERSFFAPARQIRGLKLRSVYQMNCVSGTLMDDWLKLGAKVVNGTYGKRNNYMPQSYFHFSKKWLNGESFGNAVLSAYQESRIYTEPVYKMLGLNQYVIDSRHRVLGDSLCRIAPMRNPVVATVGKVKEATTAALCAGFKAARKTAEQACRLLIQKGCKIAEVALELRKQYGASNADLCRYLKAAGCKAQDVATTLVQNLRCNAKELARCMIRAGYTADLCAREIRRLFRSNFGHIASYLRQAGCSTYTLASTLKNELRCSAGQIAKYLRQAGCHPNDIAKALKNRIKCSTKQIAKHLKSAGCSFNQTAKALWRNSRKNASALQSVAQAMVQAFQQNIAQVMGALAKLGIK